MDTRQILNSPIFASIFFSNLHIEQFVSALKINRDWYRECKWALEDRHKVYTKKYQDLEKEIKENFRAQDEFWKEMVNKLGFGLYDRNAMLSNPEYIQYNETIRELRLIKNKYDILLKDVERACIRCGFSDLVNHKRLKHYKLIYKYGSESFYIFALPKDEASIISTINTLNAIIKTALHDGFSKRSYVVTHHTKLLKNIKSSTDPNKYIFSIAKKLFPDEETFSRKYKYIERTYHYELQEKISELYGIYHKIITEEKMPIYYY